MIRWTNSASNGRNHGTQDHERAPWSSRLRHWFQQPVDDTEIPAAKAKGYLHDIWQAETYNEANDAFDVFNETYGVTWDKAVAKPVNDRDASFASSSEYGKRDRIWCNACIRPEE